MPPLASRTVFVANIPYDVSEEQIANVFSEVGPVSNVEIKFDPQTGRSKGYAFVQFYDEATALSAVRNLQDVPINGRPVRIELSTDDGGRRRPGAPGIGPGPGGPGGVFGRPGGREATPPRAGFAGRGGAGDDHPQVDLSLIPAGIDPPPGQKATDIISKTLAAVQPGQMQDVMASMKALITTQPDQARTLLSSQPQLAYALFQAMLLMNIVDPSVLQRIQPLAPGSGPAAAPAYPPAGNAYPPYQPQTAAPPAAPPANYPPYPPAPSNAPFRPPPNAGGYNAPPPPPAPAAASGGYGGYPPAVPPAAPASSTAGLPPATQAALAGLPEDQRTMLVQVLQLTPDQINALDPSQQASVKQLRQQFLGVA